jgi:hypothetical protein
MFMRGNSILTNILLGNINILCQNLCIGRTCGLTLTVREITRAIVHGDTEKVVPYLKRRSPKDLDGSRTPGYLGYLADTLHEMHVI